MNHEQRTAPARLLYRVQDAAEALSLSRSVIFELLRSGRLRSVHEGRTRLIPYEALVEYIASLEDAA
ncbi:excisionase family DNA-binding protein [Kineococcus rhizosphaerae]|uniref:Excisionase family DNA binding protein n=1 Tax=Kineococcus rhizosphaerae TaxID=559628 RepID=A0A2T0QZZ5_9ACTN|nr:helix-turn-helix domain-containing protein [Kineococcus rhizosphaerae]PRY12252.1 excisionase family DNA binding protein [Kineococcus rhizosphaerae]